MCGAEKLSELGLQHITKMTNSSRPVKLAYNIIAYAYVIDVWPIGLKAAFLIYEATRLVKIL